MNVFDLQAVLTLNKEGFEKGLNAAKTAITGMAAIGAAAMTAFGVSSVKTGAEFDKSMSQVAATMGKTTDEIKDLRDFAKEMGRTTAFSAKQAADALNYMALAGYDADTSIGMLPNVLNLAAAGSMDLARASDMVTDTQTAFGITLDRTTQMVDEMAKAASTGNTSVEQLGDAFLTVGGLAQELNGGMITLANGTKKPVDGVQELEIALTAMANAGVKGSEAGTHMRNMLLKLSSPTKEGTVALEKMGVKVFDTTGKMRSLSDIFGDLNEQLSKMTQEQKVQTISDLFNTRDLASAEALLNAVGQDWDKIGESILDAKGAAQKMADTQLDNLAGDTTKFKSALEGVQIQLSEKLSPALRKIVQAATKGLEKISKGIDSAKFEETIDKIADAVVDFINYVLNNGDKIIEGIKAIGAAFLAWKAVDVINGVTKAITTLIPGLAGAAGAASGAATSVAGFGGALGALPLVAVVGGIALLYTNMEKLNGLTDEQREHWNNTSREVQNITERYSEMQAAINKNSEAVHSETARLEDYRQSLIECYDANGNLIAGKEKHAEFCLGVLNEALGTEYNAVNMSKEAWEKEKTAIEEATKALEAKALAAEYIKQYEMAVADEINLINAQQAAQQDAAVAQENYNMAVSDVMPLEGYNLHQQELIQHLNETVEAENAATKALDENRALQQTAREMMTAIAQGEYAKVEEIERAHASTIDEIQKGLVHNIESNGEQIKSKIGDYGKGATERLSQEMSTMEKNVDKTGTQIVSSVDKSGQKTAEKANEWEKKAAENINKLPNDADCSSAMATTGSRIPQGLQSGWDSTFPSVRNHIVSDIRALNQEINNIQKIKSPSRVWADIASYMAKGLGKGWDETFPGVKDDIVGDMLELSNYNYKTSSAPGSGIGAGKLMNVLTSISDKLDKISNGQQIVLDTGVLVGQTVDKMDIALGRLAGKNMRGVYV